MFLVGMAIAGIFAVLALLRLILTALETNNRDSSPVVQKSFPSSGDSGRKPEIVRRLLSILNNHQYFYRIHKDYNDQYYLDQHEIH